MKNQMTYAPVADFYFFMAYLAHKKVDLTYWSNQQAIDALYENCKAAYETFEVSPYYVAKGSYLQAIKDFFQSLDEE